MPKRIFLVKSEIFKHMSVHTNDQLFKCERPGCNKTFLSKSGFRLHKNSHDIERTFKCDTCDKTYRSLPGLNRHLLNHGDPTFKCNKCSKTFYSKRYLKRHISVHNYPCDICNLSFRTRVLLDKHSKTHVKNQCHVCGKEIKGSDWNFRRHIAKHNDLGRNECKLCFKSFQSEEFLEMHLLYHKERYQCSLCQRSYKRAFSLKRHLKINHKEDTCVSKTTDPNVF
jgi:KRAB domain-containing zinc finger protein